MRYRRYVWKPILDRPDEKTQEPRVLKFIAYNDDIIPDENFESVDSVNSNDVEDYYG